MSNRLPTVLPTPTILESDPYAIPGLKLVSATWTTSDGAVLQCVPNYGRPVMQYVAFYECVFERADPPELRLPEGL